MGEITEKTAFSEAGFFLGGASINKRHWRRKLKYSILRGAVNKFGLD